MTVVLLEATEEEGLVLADRSPDREPVNIVTEDRFRSSVQSVQIGDRVKPLRLVTPQQSAMQAVGAGLGDDIEDATARASELDPEVPGLNGNLLDSVADGKWLGYARELHVIVFRAIQDIVISAGALAVNGELRTSGERVPVAGPEKAARSLGHTGQRAREREWIQRNQRQIADLVRMK